MIIGHFLLFLLLPHLTLCQDPTHPIHVQHIRPGCDRSQDDIKTGWNSSDSCCNMSSFLAGDRKHTFKSVTITDRDLADSCDYPDQRVLGGSIIFSSESLENRLLGTSCPRISRPFNCSCAGFDLMAPTGMKFKISAADSTEDWNVRHETLAIYDKLFDIAESDSFNLLTSVKYLEYSPFVVSESNRITLRVLRDDIGKTSFNINFTIVPDFTRQLQVVCSSASHGTNSESRIGSFSCRRIHNSASCLI